MRRIALFAAVSLFPSPPLAAASQPLPPFGAASVAPAHGIRPGMSVGEVRQLMRGTPRESGVDRFGVYDRFASGITVYYQLGSVDRTGNPRDAEFTVKRVAWRDR